MKKYTLFIIFFACTMFQSQISMEYAVISQKETYNLKLKVNILNKSNDYYILPLDTKGFKGYYESEYCGAFEDQDYPYHFFAPTVMLKKIDESSDYLFPGSSRGHMPENKDAEKYIKDIQKTADNELKEINDWKKKYSFKSYKDALKNRYITKNILLLKPHEKYSYEISLDLGNINRTNTSILYDYYILEFAKYNLSLHLCITSDAYSWLTKKQKQKKYKFFTGKIESNKIELN